MKFKKIASVFLVSALMLTGCSTTGGSNSEGTAKKEDIKVVAASMSATEVLDKLDADVVGVPTTKADLPEKFKDTKQVGQAMSPDFEVVKSLDPELFIMDANFQESVESTLKDYDLNSYFFNTGTYSEFVDSIKALGQKIDREEEAQKLVDELQGSVDKAVAKKGEDAPTVAVLFGAGENLMLATKDSYIGDLLNTIGAKNISDNLDGVVQSGYMQYSLEKIVEQNPDYILRFSPNGTVEANKAMFDEVFSKNPAYSELTAVKEDKVVDLDTNVFKVSANIKVGQAIETLGDILYGK